MWGIQTVVCGKTYEGIGPSEALAWRSLASDLADDLAELWLEYRRGGGAERPSGSGKPGNE
jgi:hypothetical protein